jgi:hypothetical protein
MIQELSLRASKGKFVTFNRYYLMEAYGSTGKHLPFVNNNQYLIRPWPPFVNLLSSLSTGWYF